jgi:imidazolonepropionase-like amidohydrolase
VPATPFYDKNNGFVTLPPDHEIKIDAEVYSLATKQTKPESFAAILVTSFFDLKEILEGNLTGVMASQTNFTTKEKILRPMKVLNKEKVKLITGN